ncbi:hypothetical protein BJF83_16080 [Nocardiopsis sp. CNR-923]|nr:hypothetical protein BJF83_16080 [Nocardiopsis sp. CNR-923]
MFAESPDMAVEFLRERDVRVPEYERSEITSCDLGHVDPVERRSDVAILLRGEGPKGLHDSLMGVIVEVQRDPSERKRFTWPEYLACLRSRHECPVALLVICPRQSVADDYAGPIELGHPGFVLRPLVIGPKDIPVVTDPATVAASPALGVLSAAAHGARKAGVLDALNSGLDKIDPEKAAKYIGYSLHLLADTDGQQALEALMMANTFDYHSPWVDSLRAEGEARMLLRVLTALGVEVTEDARARITGCDDVEQLEAWADRAPDVSTVDQLFAE